MSFLAARASRSQRAARIIVLGAATLSGCSRPAADPTPAAVKVVSTPVVRAEIVEWDEYVGRLEATDFVEVRARVSGYLDSTHFVEGQIVKEGDLLCIIDPRPYAVAVKRAEAAVQEAKAQELRSKAELTRAEANKKDAEAKLALERQLHERSQQLVGQKVVPKEELDIRDAALLQATASVESADADVAASEAAISTAAAMISVSEAALEAAKLNLEYTEVRAPITGRISARLVTEGNLISGGAAQSTVITTIVSLDPIYCQFDADEQSYLKYARLAREGKRQSSRDVKNPVYVGLADEPNQFPHRGYMEFVDNRMDPETGTMRARAILPNPDLSLTPGLFARLRLPGSGRYDAVMIPDMVAGTDQSEKFVYVVEKDSKIRRQVVELGPIVRGLRVVRNGLEGNEQVVLRGLQRVRPGSKVAATVEQVALTEDGLPDDAQPIPEERWLTRTARTGSPAAALTDDGGIATPDDASNKPANEPAVEPK